MDKKRSANFTTREKDIIISLVEKYFKILENKKTNAVFNKQKAECWEKLAWEYNANQTSGLRTGSQLKSLYEQMKKLAKQHKADEKVEVLKTGGGSFESKLTSQDEKILCLLEKTYFSINNEFDSNSEKSIPGPSGIQRTDNSGSYPNIDNNSENIVIIYDESVQETNENISLNFLDTEEEPPKKKKKVVEKQNENINETNTQIKEKSFKQSASSLLTEKRLEISKEKLNVLKVIKETEMENLRGKKIDNEIKEIIKERELIELKIKKLQFANLKS